jgi:hypothetical protein
MARQKWCPINQGEVMFLKAAVHDLSELAAKQALYAIIQVLAGAPHIRRPTFEEIIDDAKKLTEAKKSQVA